MPEPIRHIVFDVGHVLLQWEMELAFVEIIPDAEERRWFLDNVWTPERNRELDRGLPWREAEDRLFELFPERAAQIRAFRTNWYRTVPGPVDGTPAVMEGLIADGHDVTMLTNFSADTFAEARERFEFLNAPRGVTVSGEVRLMKPEREIYELHARQFGLAPAHTLFIDDSAANVQGAIDAGWQAIRFVDAPTLAGDLAARGVVVR